MTVLFCCLVALVLAASLFVEPVMSKLAVFVTHRRAVAGVAGVLLLMVTLAVPAARLFLY
ncbi:MAG: hypothetical protein GZ089_06530 [Aromatoleum sp.]|nr:hypothetical protein [Aromatoleum sp.]